MTSTSVRAFRSSAATWAMARAGGSETPLCAKNCAYALFTSPKSYRSVTWIVAFTMLLALLLAALRIAPILARA